MEVQVKDRVFDWLSYYADFDPGRIADIDLATSRWLTYGALNDRATRLARALRERFGIGAFDRVAFIAHNSEKRFKKLLPLKTRRDLFVIEGDKDAELGIVSWGSGAGVALEALRLARQSGIKAELLVPRMLYPVPEDIYQDFFASVKRGFVLEQSHQGQFYRVLRMFVDVPHGMVPMARSGSNPFSPKEVLGKVREVARGVHHARAPELHPQE